MRIYVEQVQILKDHELTTLYVDFTHILMRDDVLARADVGVLRADVRAHVVDRVGARFVGRTAEDVECDTWDRDATQGDKFKTRADGQVMVNAPTNTNSIGATLLWIFLNP